MENAYPGRKILKEIFLRGFLVGINISINDCVELIFLKIIHQKEH